MRSLTAVIVLVSLSSPLLAQSAPAPGVPAAAIKKLDANVTMAKLDTDKNGSIEKSEWLAAGRREQGFALFDTDQNDKLSLDELKAGFALIAARQSE